MNEENEKLHFIVLLARVAIALTLSLLANFLFVESKFGLATNLSISLVAYLIISYDLYIEAFEKIFHEKEIFNEITLMIVASIGAFCLRLFGPGENKFFEAVLVILLYQVGEMLQDLAEDKSKKTISKTLDFREEKVKIIENCKVFEIEAEQVKIGKIVVLGQGNKVYTDGKIVEGECYVNEASLTGESTPILKGVGDEIYSTSLIVKGSCKIEVTSDYENSVANKLLTLLEQSRKERSNVDKFVTRFAKIYTPIILCLALIVAAICPLIIGSINGTLGSRLLWSQWIYISLSFLVISCPCAIVISIPLAYFSGIGLASKNSIIVKGGIYFDKLNAIKTIFFDKTGTLTKGNFKVSEIQNEGITKEELIEYVSAAESNSSHPLAKSILKELNGCYEEDKISSYQEISGKGISLVYKEKNIFVGSKNNGEIEKRGGTYINIWIDEVFSGYVVLVDEPKDDLKEMIKYLKDKKIETVLISGDRKENVEIFAKEFGISSHYGELSPNDKVDHVRKKKAEGMVAFVGDGINDIGSIGLADVSVSMGSIASDAVIENSDIVVASDKLNSLIALFKISKKTYNVAMFNLVFCLIVKAAVLIYNFVYVLVGLPELPLWAAVITDSGLALLLVLNSLRLFFTKISAKTR